MTICEANKKLIEDLKHLDNSFDDRLIQKADANVRNELKEKIEERINFLQARQHKKVYEYHERYVIQPKLEELFLLLGYFKLLSEDKT